MEPINQDANPQTEPQAPLSADSSPATGAPTPASPSGATDDKKDYSDMVVVQTAEPSPAKTPEAPPAEGDVKKLNATSPKEEPASGELPWHKDERFQTFIKEKKEFEALRERAVAAMERERARQEYCLQNNITDDQLQQALEIQGLINTNPAEAYKKLQPVFDYLNKFQGAALPQDLQNEVEAGSIPLERARELASLRTQHEFAQRRYQQATVQNAARLVHQSLSDWEARKQQFDPDYAKKQAMINKAFVALSATQPWQTPEQAVALAERAYEEVNMWAKQFIPPPAPIKTLSSNGSSVAQMTEPKTWNEVDDFVMRKFTGGR